jgi:hypothetical protein
MVVQIKNNLGVFEPLDIFEDFEIRYNHQYDDYNEVGGKRIPYTNKFKIPLTDRNRYLCGIPFDATYPLFHSVAGRMLYSSGTVAFNFIADIEKQTINVLEPYIEISIIDLISKALSDLSKWKMSDLMAGNTFNISTDTWMFGTQADLTTSERYFLFPYFNFNNKNAVFAYDANRHICQLQPTFILNKLVDKIFGYVGQSVDSDFLNLDNQLYTGINANELGMMIPCILKTNSNYEFSANQYFTGWATSYGDSYSGVSTERVIGVPSIMNTSSRMVTTDFLQAGVEAEPLKMNYDWRSDITFNGQAYGDPLGRKFTSMVDGKLKIKITSNNTAIKPRVGFGRLRNSDATGLNNWLYVTAMDSLTPQDLDVKIVQCNMEDVSYGFLFVGGSFETSDSYDIKTAQSVGTAVFAGVVDGVILYDIVFNQESNVVFDVEANEDIELGLVLTSKTSEPMIEKFYATDSYDSGSYIYNLKIGDGYIEYERVDGSPKPDTYYDQQLLIYTKLSGANMYPTTFTYSYEEETEIPSGFSGIDINGDLNRENVWINNCVVDMGLSMKSVKDYTLLEIIKMIMERYNLQLYTKSDGTIHLDTAKNRMSGYELPIDHLIDEGIDVEFTFSENGILSIRDGNPSFYEDKFNLLDKLQISDYKRDEISVSFNSAIVSDKMFVDKYDGSGYDLLEYGHDTNFWGVTDRAQLTPKDLSPTFLFLKAGSTPVYFPFNNCSYSYYDPDPDSTFADFGFYNSFHHIPTIHPTLSLEATNVHPNGFKLYSFEKNALIAGDNNLYKMTWYPEIMNKMNDESVIMSLQIYVSEFTLAKLMDFADIYYKGQKWTLQGFNNYPLSDMSGGVCDITIIKQKDWTIPPPVIVTDTDSDAFILATGITDTVQKSALNTLVTGLKTYNIWNKLKAIYPFVGGTAGKHKYNLKDPRDLNSAFRLSFINVQHSSNGIVQTDQNGYANTFLSPLAEFTLSSASFGMNCKADGVSTNGLNMYVFDSGESTGIMALITADDINQSNANIFDLSSTSATQVSPVGFSLMSRESNNSVKLYHNGNLLASNLSATSTSIPSSYIYLMNGNVGNVNQGTYTGRQYSFCTIGGGLTATEALNLSNLIQAFNTSLNR